MRNRRLFHLSRGPFEKFRCRHWYLGSNPATGCHARSKPNRHSLVRLSRQCLSNQLELRQGGKRRGLPLSDSRSRLPRPVPRTGRFRMRATKKKPQSLCFSSRRLPKKLNKRTGGEASDGGRAGILNDRATVVNGKRSPFRVKLGSIPARTACPFYP